MKEKCPQCGTTMVREGSEHHLAFQKKKKMAPERLAGQDGQPPATPEAPTDFSELKKLFVARTEQFRSLGHDRLAAARYVAEAGGETGGPALDVGTGKGLLAMALARRGLDVVSVDTSAEDVPLASGLAAEEGLAPRIRFLTSDAASLPFPDGHFATCASMDALHHLQDGRAVLSEMVRVLRPGGTLVVADFDLRGFEIVARLHGEEGHSHPEGNVTNAWADGFLTGLGLAKIKGEEGHDHVVAVFKKPETAKKKGVPHETVFSGMGKDELLKALGVFAKNWLAHDGCWFLAAEDRYGQEAAMDLDAKSWARFSVAEATRLMAAFQIPPGGGLEALEKVLERRMYALINPQRVEWSPDRSRLRFHMQSCRVQEGRRRKNLPDFPCKPVGLVEFSGLARTVDPRIRVRCLSCPPDPSEGDGCSWEFGLESEPEV
jgi:ubiquinone/menaquinone biosynthesis C-methylase UbiE